MKRFRPSGHYMDGGPRATQINATQFQEPSVYGLSFSPNSQLLYVTTIGAPSRLYQIVIGTVQINLVTTGSGVAGVKYDLGQLQLGPGNQAIYVARDGSNTISAITSPDSIGASACGFGQVGATLGSGATSRLGLPTIVQGPFSCAIPTPACPPGMTSTIINGVTFCCTTSPTGQLCCTRPCPPGTVETTINGTTYCCETHGPINESTTQFCCTPKP